MGKTNNLIDACLANNDKKVRQMISEGVDINWRDEFGGTALMYAMERGTTELVSILLGCADIKIDATDRQGWTALHLACCDNNVENVQLFLTHPTCTQYIVRMKNKDGDTAEMVAEYFGNRECARLIREFDAKEDKKSIDEQVGKKGKKAVNNNTLQSRSEYNKDFVEFIESQIKKKEKELECPVCLVIANTPIFMCSEQHLICGACRPKVSHCPMCRVKYKGKNRRHRYAEKIEEEINELKEKKAQVKK